MTFSPQLLRATMEALVGIMFLT